MRITGGQVFDLESVYKEVVVLEKEQLEDLKKAGLITQEEYQEKRHEILSRL